MLDKVLIRLNKTLRKTINNQADEIKYLRAKYKDDVVSMLEDFGRILMQIQQVKTLENMTEEEKDRHRDNIINSARAKYLDKLIELSSRQTR